MALLSWSSRLLLRKGLKSWKNIVGSKRSQNSENCVDVLLPPPKKLESSVTSSIKPDSHLGQVYSGSLGLTSPLQKWQKNRCAATAEPAPAPAAEASAIFLFRHGCPSERAAGRSFARPLAPGCCRLLCRLRRFLSAASLSRARASHVSPPGPQRRWRGG